MNEKYEHFATPEEFLKSIQDGNDYYNPDKGIYVFVYNDAGSIAYYFLDDEEVVNLRDQSEEDGEYWGAHLGVGGYICEDPSYEDYKSGDFTNLDFCKQVYKLDWENVTPSIKELEKTISKEDEGGISNMIIRR